jgi:glutamate formiminotransferase
MPLIAIPNVSTGSDDETIRALAEVVELTGAALLDIHSDAVHDRSVFTVSGATDNLIEAMVGLAVRARRLNLTTQYGVHHRLGVLDVCPFVPHGETTIDEAILAGRSAGAAIAERAALPVYLYGAAAARPETRDLPQLRRGGLKGLRARAAQGLPPDFGGPQIDERVGIVCVGARGVLIAFNVWLRCEIEFARGIAARVREAGGGLAGVRSLGLVIQAPDICQISMNLTAPLVAGIEAAFEAVASEAEAHAASVLATEIVGLPPERFFPSPNARATRLLREPGRTLESALSEAGL